MYLNKAPVRNRTIDRKFNRRIAMTQQMSKIDRRRQRLSQHESLYGKIHYRTRDYSGDLSLGCSLISIIGVLLSVIPLAWLIYSIAYGASIMLPLVLSMTLVIPSVWLLTIEWSYRAYYIVMGKYYDRKIERISVKRAKVLPNTFVTAVADSLGRDEFDAVLLLACYPGRLSELYEAYKDKVATIDSTKNDSDTYREARRILVDILREDLKDILDEERSTKKAERKADELQAAKERQRRRAEAERNQEVLRDLRSFYDTYKRLGA